jgi:molecular chaperone GrpE
MQKPWVKTLLDVADALSVARRQAEKTAARVPVATDSPEPAANPTSSANSVRRPHFLARLFGAETVVTVVQSPPPPAYDVPHLVQQLRAVADGYAMSLRRIEAALPQFGLEPILCDGCPFDPECMEVVDTVPSGPHPSGHVAEVLRIGYRWHGQIFRYAQVKVAK